MQTALAVKILAALLALVFPPLGVIVRRGVSYHLAVNLILTILLWIPGLVHALYHCVVDVVQDPGGPAHGHGPGERLD